MSEFSFNIVCSSLGRTSLPTLINSFESQLTERDYFTIISDNNHDYVKNCLNKDFKFNVNHIVEEGPPSGIYGHPILNKHINNLDGDFIMFADDDDRYVPDAFEFIRNVVKEKKLYIFKHKWGDTINWREKKIEVGNIGKCMGVIPNTKSLPKFDLSYHGSGDGMFYVELGKIFDYEFVDKIIYKVRNTE